MASLGDELKKDCAKEEASQGLEITHPLCSLAPFLQTFGPSAITLYRFSLASRRILFYTKPPLQPAVTFAWLTWALGQGPSRVGKGEFLGQVGLMDMDVLKASEGWVACESARFGSAVGRSFGLMSFIMQARRMLSLKNEPTCTIFSSISPSLHPFLPLPPLPPPPLPNQRRSSLPIRHPSCSLPDRPHPTHLPDRQPTEYHIPLPTCLYSRLFSPRFKRNGG